MSSINPHYTLHYEQPQAYYFSHDSVFLARRVFEIVQQQGLISERVLDLCAGCGVVGLDFLYHLQAAGRTSPSHIDFLEVQTVYQKYFAQNIAKFRNLKTFEFLNYNYDQDDGRTYDLILCNPPYFRMGAGALAPSEFKNRCRFFIDSSFEALIGAIQKKLRAGGSAFVLLKSLKDADLRKISHQVNIKPLEKIRTTDLYQIQNLI